MPRSLTHGDYTLLAWIESPRTAGQWYRVLADVRPPHALSCDCPGWVFTRRAAGGARTCKHVQWVEGLLQAQPRADAAALLRRPPQADDPLIEATRAQWAPLAPLAARWHLERRDARIGDAAYQVVFLQMVTHNGLAGTGLIALAGHPRQERELHAEVAVRAGYAIICDLAHQSGYADGQIGQPPSHFAVTSGQVRRALRGIGFADVLRLDNVVDLGDGLTPAQRAENTLQLFLGETLYRQLGRQGFLDVPSRLHGAEERVYRLRRDPDRRRPRRVRVFERGRYVHDLCIVPSALVPEADHFLTVFLGLITDEASVLAVVKQHNVFPPHSDDHGHPDAERVPARWVQPAAQA